MCDQRDRKIINEICLLGMAGVFLKPRACGGYFVHTSVHNGVYSRD
jgi:hypothetical protein